MRFNNLDLPRRLSSACINTKFIAFVVRSKARLSKMMCFGRLHYQQIQTMHVCFTLLIGKCSVWFSRHNVKVAAGFLVTVISHGWSGWFPRGLLAHCHIFPVTCWLTHGKAIQPCPIEPKYLGCVLWAARRQKNSSAKAPPPMRSRTNSSIMSYHGMCSIRCFLKTRVVPGWFWLVNTKIGWFWQDWASAAELYTAALKCGTPEVSPIGLVQGHWTETSRIVCN